MSEEIWEAYAFLKEQSAEKKKRNIQSSTATLKKNGVDFESKNSGIHLVVKNEKHIIDFWPSTGLWAVRGSDKKSRGVMNLMKFIK